MQRSKSDSEKSESLSLSKKSCEDFFDKLRGTKVAPRAPIPHMR